MRKVLVIAVCLTLSGCGASFPKADPNQVMCTATGDVDPRTMKFPTPPDPPPIYRIAYADDGEFIDRCAVSKLYRDMQAGGDQIVLLYVHGWKHNNDDRDTDLQKFTNQVRLLRNAETSSASPRRVLGVYVAWNGARTTWPVAKQFTFWGRQRAADKVAQSAAVTRLLAAVDSIRRQRESRNRNDLHVYVGHSFGARILYNAVAQTLIRETELAHPGEVNKPYRRIKGIGDMVILLNPAFEASLFSIFHDVRRSEYIFPPEQPPLLVSISSETDRATGRAFPLGQALSFERSPKRRITVGNYKDYWTHRVARRSTSNENDDCSKQVCMTLIAMDGLKNVPFINARADRAVMNGHGDIWNENVQEFITHLIERRIVADKLNAPQSAIPASPSASRDSPVTEKGRD